MSQFSTAAKVLSSNVEWQGANLTSAADRDSLSEVLWRLERVLPNASRWTAYYGRHLLKCSSVLVKLRVPSSTVADSSGDMLGLDFSNGQKEVLRLLRLVLLPQC